MSSPLDADADAKADTDDLDGWLLLAAMAEPHAHLDKALTADEVPNPKGDLMGAITAWFAAAEDGRLSYERTVERAAQAMEMLLVHGCTAVRTHINITADIGISSLLAVQEAARGFDGLIDLQTVALTGWPMTGPDKAPNVAALEQAIEAGVDLVGGVPNLQDDPEAHIGDVLAMAAEAGIDIDLHTDETLDPSVLTLRELARQVNDKGFDGSVAASHCVSLGMQPPDVQAAVAAEVAAAGISVIALAADQPVPTGPRRRRGHAEGPHRGCRRCVTPGRWWPPAPTTCKTRSTWWAAAIRWRPRR